MMSSFGPLQTRRDVWLNDLPFSSVDELGNRWLITDIDGWWDLPAPTMGEVDRAYSEDGSYYEPGRYQSRTLRMTGRIIPQSNKTNAANIARQELNKRLMLVRKTGLLQVLESPELGGGKQTEVVITARPIVTETRINGVIEFDLQFRAPDPRKYSVVESVAEALLVGGEYAGRTYNLVHNRTYEGDQDRSTAIVRNEGDYNTYGVVRLNGPIDDPGANHIGAGRSISFTGLRLAVGQYIDVNLREKTIISESGISLRDRMDDGSRWFNFDPGVNRISLSGTQYLDPVPTVPDVQNYIPNPSYEADMATSMEVVRRNYVLNPAGTTQMDEIFVRESIFMDSQAEDPENFEGTVENGVIKSSTVKLAPGGDRTFIYDGTDTHHFVQMDLNPDIDMTTKLYLGDNSSGDVVLPAGQWTTVRVDSHIPSEDYEITIKTEEGSNVQVRNIMVLRSTDPIAGDTEFWDPVLGIDENGLETTELPFGGYRQSYYVPLEWSLPGNPDSRLRVVEDVTYLMPSNIDPHVIDFGPASTPGKEVSYGVLAEGLTEVRLYDNDTGDLLDTRPSTPVAALYTSDTEFTPRLEATINVDGAGDPIDRPVTGAMVTYDGGERVFTDQTPDADNYFYSYVSDEVPAVESVASIVPSDFTDQYNKNARIVSSRSYDGKRGLEVVYNSISSDPTEIKRTPVTTPSFALAAGTYYVRARVMSNKSTSLEMGVGGTDEDIVHAFSTNPNFWADVSFSFETSQTTRPFVTVSPMVDDGDLEIYVDTVGILTQDEPYFDGSMPGPYRWTGTPHSSTSATIPVVGVPTAKMEIMYRNAWIG